MLYVKENANVYRIASSDILYMQQNGRNVRIVTSQKDYMLKRHKIKDMEIRLGEGFFKCHSYLIVNKDKIKEVYKNEAVFEGGRSVGMCYAAALRLRKTLLTAADSNKT